MERRQVMSFFCFICLVVLILVVVDSLHGWLIWQGLIDWFRQLQRRT